MRNTSKTSSFINAAPRSLITLCAAAAFCALAASSASAAPTLINGSLEGPLAYNTPPTGWTIGMTKAETPDTVDQTHNFGTTGYAFAATPSASADGGTWVGLARGRSGANSSVEGILQTVSGFTIGNVYTLKWYHANFGYANANSSMSYLGSNAIEVFADGVSIGSGATRAVGSGWVEESINFVAAETELDLAFTSLLDVNDAFNSWSYQAIDGIRLTELPPVDPPAGVPEPATLSLFSSAGLALLLAGRRRKQARKVDQA